MKNKEILRLKNMLDKVNIPYEFYDRSELYFKLYQIIVYKNNERLISVIQGTYSYGGDSNLLEIMGCLTEEESNIDSVVGYLTAEEVFERIMNNYSSMEE